MKKAILTTILSICIPILVFGVQTNDLKNQGDSAKIQEYQQVLHVKGAKVYGENGLLTKSEVLNILSGSPAIAAQYERAAGTKSAGTALIIGGAVLATGGIVMMVSGMETVVDYNGYESVEFGDKYYTGLLVSVAGELMAAGGIACTIIGKAKIRKSVSNYNNSLNQTGYVPIQVNYQIGLLDNGNFGLKLTF